MEDEPPLVIDVGPAMFSLSEVSWYLTGYTVWDKDYGR